MDLKKEKNILSNVRTKETYRSKIKCQSRGSQNGVLLSVGNFENYCMQQYGKPNIIPDMLESTEIERIDTLQLWINYMNEVPSKRSGLDMKNSKGNNEINTHSFRAFGITKLSRHDANYARRLAGQKGYLDTYDRFSLDDKLKL